MNFLCDANTTNVVTTVIVVVLLAVMLIFPYFTQKKRNQEYENMLSAIKVGDLIKTAGGVIGKVTKITDKGEIKTVIVETGSKTDKSYMEFDMASIYCVLKSTKVEEKPAEETEKEEKVEEKTEVADTEEPAEEKKPVAKKTTSKKTTTKKTSTKKTASK